MRSKILLILGVMMLSIVASSSAAHAKVVKVEIGGVPVAPGQVFELSSPNATFLGQGISCQWSGIQLTLVKNQSDPATMSGSSGPVNCNFNGTPLKSATLQVGTFSLNATGTGSMPLVLDVVYPWGTKCKWSGTTNLSFTSGTKGELQFEGSLSGPGCAYGTFYGWLQVMHKSWGIAPVFKIV